MSSTNSDERSSSSQAKKSKSDSGESCRLMEVPADQLNQERSTHILQLNFDCFELMFKWLSLKDLFRIRLTCKQFKEYADIYIPAKYPKQTFDYGRVEIDGDTKQFAQLEPQLAKLIKKIKITLLELNDEDINNLKPILGQIDALELENVLINEEFYKAFFQFCPNVRHLAINGAADKLIIGPDNTWLQRKYPNLRSLHIDDTDEAYETYTGNGESVKELAQFFQLNPNVRTFSTTHDYFRVNWKWLSESYARIDLLKIQTPLSTRQIDHDFCNALKKLYFEGVYRRLRLSNVEITSQKDLNLISTIPALETLYLEQAANFGIVIPPTMPSLTEIGFIYIRPKRRLAKSLVNVERIYLESAAPIDILPFIRYSYNVEILYVDDLDSGTHFENGIVDVAALNKERLKLNDACKMTIYVKEDIYLATKRASFPTKCSLVELDRAEASWFDNQKFK